MWQGPLPPPQTLRDFDAVEPGLSREIIDAWKDETLHRRSMETREISALEKDMLLRPVFALIFVLSALAFAAYAVSQGAQWVGAVIGGATIVGVVTAFLSSKPKS